MWLRYCLSSGALLALWCGPDDVWLAQVAAHYGYISVNWAKMHKQVAASLDLDRNGCVLSLHPVLEENKVLARGIE